MAVRTLLRLLPALFLLLGFPSTGRADQIQVLPLETNWLIGDPVTGKLFVTFGSSAGARGNSVAPIDPVSGVVGNSVFVGSEPSRMAASDDGQFLYVYLDGSAQMRRVRIPTMTPDLQFPLGSDGLGSWRVEDLEVVPGQPHLLMATMYHPGISPRSVGTAVYYDGVRRPDMNRWGNGHTCDSNGTRAFIFHNETTGAGIWQVSIGPNGLTHIGGNSNVLNGFGIYGKFHKGLIYANNSALYDPETDTILGTYSGGQGVPVVDDGLNRVYFLTGWGKDVKLLAYAKDTFLKVGELPIPTADGGTSCFTGWGTDGFAFRTKSQIFIIRTSLRSGPPTPPSALAAVPASGGSIQLTWNDNSINENGFRIERSQGTGAFAEIAAVGADVARYTDTGLGSNQTYSYRVRAAWSGGFSGYSNTVSATTRPVPAAPRDLKAATVSPSQIDLTWTDASTDESAFEIERQIGSGAWQLRATVGRNVARYSDVGLAPATTYSYRVRATSAEGDSPFSLPATATTRPGPPAAPSGLEATALSQKAAKLEWRDNGATETGFRIERSEDGSTFAQVFLAAKNAVTWTDDRLEAGVTYWYRVKATNEDGDSPPSNTATVTTLPVQPAVPTGLRVTTPPAPAGISRLLLLWSDNSSNEDGFRVERSPDGRTFTQVGTAPRNAASYEDSGLWDNTPYYYRIRAYNAGGVSPYTAVVIGRTLPAPPVAPSGLTGVARSQTEIELTWSDRSSNETGFKIERAQGAGGTFQPVGSTPAGARLFRNSGLTPGTTYRYRVRATNAGGDSQPSGEVSVTTLPLAPSAPSGLAAAAVSQTEIRLSWKDESTNENGFSLERRQGTALFRIVASLRAGVTTYADKGLTPNTSYHYRVRAENSGGKSEYSNIASAQTLPALPGAPVGLAANVTSPTEVVLTWRAGPGVVDGYRLERALGSGAFQERAATPGTVLTFKDTRLTPNTAYRYRVKAFNRAGDSLPSAVGTAATPADVPQAPTGLLVTRVTATDVALSWNDTSTNEDGFKVERSADGGRTFGEAGRVGWGIKSYTDTRLQPSTRYHYRVLAFNGGGSSAPSSMVEATTAAAIGGTLEAPAQLGFGRVKRGKTKTLDLEIRNAHASEILEVTVGAATGPFRVVTRGGSVRLQPGATHRIQVSFRPTRKGKLRGSLALRSTDPARRTAAVALAGRGK